MRFQITLILICVLLINVCLGQSRGDSMQTAINPIDSQLYVWIPPSTFQMGCSPDDSACQVMEPFANENPRHSVVITKGFWIGQTEVTVSAYKKYARATGRKTPEELVKEAPERYRDISYPRSDNHPVSFVTWEDAMQYCEWAGGRLPSEAEWEYSARAGDVTSRYGNLDEIAWYANNSGDLRLNNNELDDPQRRRQLLKDNKNVTHPVGKKIHNEFGLYDMLGNVIEYCSDWYDENYYELSLEKDPGGPASGQFRVIRGGSYWHRELGVRVSYRSYMLPDHRFNSIGFRCVLDSFPK